MPLTFKEQPREMVGMDEWHLSSCVKLHHDPVFMVGHALWPFPALAWRLSHLIDCLISSHCHRTPGKK